MKTIEEKVKNYWYQGKEILNGEIPPRYEIISGILDIAVRHRKYLDVGCNSGLLPLMALKKGAKKSFGVDAQENFIIQAEMANESWIKKGIISHPATFICDDIDNRFEILEEVNVVSFLRVLYHMATRTKDVFEVLSKKRNVIIICQGNLRRRGRAAKENTLFRNKLGLIEGMSELFDMYDLEYFQIEKDIMIAYHKNPTKDTIKRITRIKNKYGV